MVKETKMVIKVDLQCCRCYKKIKKILCKFPQIRDQVYDEKNNTVTITVVCCSPEKIKQNICCKGGDTIKCIEIKEPTTPQRTTPPPTTPTPQPTTQPTTPQPTTQPTTPPTTTPEVPDPPVVTGIPPAPTAFVPVLIPIGCPPANSIGVCCGECFVGRPGGPCFRVHGRPASPPPNPIGDCCQECSEGRTGGPCFRGHGRPAPPPPNPIGDCCQECSEGRTGGPCVRGLEGYGRPVCDSWAGGCRAGYYPSRCDYFCEENPSSCTIM